MRIAVMLGVLVALGCLFGFSPGEDRCMCEKSAVVMDSSPMLLQYAGMSPLTCSMSIWCSGISMAYTGPNLYTCTYQISWWHYHPDFTVTHYKHRCRLYRDNGFWLPDALLNSEGWAYWQRENNPSNGEQTQTCFAPPDFAIVEAEIFCSCGNSEEFASVELWFHEPE